MGATFAYFAVTVSGGNSTTTVTGKVGKIPTITLSNKTQNMYLNVSAAEMAQEKVESKYYALAESEATSCKTASSCNKTTQNDVDIFDIKVENGENDAKYACTGNVKVTVSGDMVEDNEELQSGDVTIVLTNLNGTDDTVSLDLLTLKNASNTQSNSLKFTINGNDTKTIKAYVMLENQDADQKYLAGKNLTVKIETENVQCPALSGE